MRRIGYRLLARSIYWKVGKMNIKIQVSALKLFNALNLMLICMWKKVNKIRQYIFKMDSFSLMELITYRFAGTCLFALVVILQRTRVRDSPQRTTTRLRSPREQEKKKRKVEEGNKRGLRSSGGRGNEKDHPMSRSRPRLRLVFHFLCSLKCSDIIFVYFQINLHLGP